VFPLFRFGGEELEGEHRSIGGEKVADQHEIRIVEKPARKGNGKIADDLEGAATAAPSTVIVFRPRRTGDAPSNG
jgi:hypothetical protein